MNNRLPTTRRFRSLAVVFLASAATAVAHTAAAGAPADAAPVSRVVGILVAIGMFLVLEPLVLYLTFKRWFHHPNAPMPSPERFFHAAIYSFGAMIVTGSILTRFFSGVDMSNTPISRFWGYNNICVVFDSPPSTYICPVYWFFIGYLLVRYAIEDTKRLVALSSTSVIEKRLGYSVNVALVLVAAFFSLCLAIRPEDDMYGHTLPFVALLIVLPLTSVMHCWVRRGRTTLHVSFVSVYMGLSIVKACFNIYGLSTGTPVLVKFAQPVDLAWTLCAIAAPFLIPPPIEQEQAAPAMTGSTKAFA
jgi:hypothetical protein